MYFKTPRLILALAVAGLVSVPVAASQYSFSCISGNDPLNCADGASRLQMVVTSAGTTALGVNQVDFTFRNLSPLGASITEIYFDSATLLGIASVSDSGSGVDFSQIGKSQPRDLPAGNSLTHKFQVTPGFVIDIGSGGNTKGVENKLDDSATQEFVTVRFNLISGNAFTDTLLALDGPLGDGLDLRVGLHVRGFDGGGSESFVNLPAMTSPVPEPAQWAMLLAGLVVLAARRRRVR
jgi:PEP-CTERM motif